MIIIFFYYYELRINYQFFTFWLVMIEAIFLVEIVYKYTQKKINETKT